MGRSLTQACVVSVTEGEVGIRLDVSAEIAPLAQVVVFAILPSETVIAKSADFAVEKCFNHKVSVFSPAFFCFCEK